MPATLVTASSAGGGTPSPTVQERTKPLTHGDKPRLKAELTRTLANEIEKCWRVRSTVGTLQWRILVAVLLLGTCGPGGPGGDWESLRYRRKRWVPLSDLLLHLGKREGYIREELDYLSELDYIDAGDNSFCLTGHAAALPEFADALIKSVIKLEGDEEIVAELIEELLPA